MWGSPINVAEASFGDNLVKAILPNPSNNGVIVIYHEESFMGVSLNMVSVSEDGEVSTQMSLCSDCENPHYESHAIGDNEFIVTYRATSGSLASGVYSQIFSYTGEMLGDSNGT